MNESKKEELMGDHAQDSDPAAVSCTYLGSAGTDWTYGVSPFAVM